MGEYPRVCAVLIVVVSAFAGAALPAFAGSGLDALFANAEAPDRLCLGDGAGGFTCSDAGTTGTEIVYSLALGFVDDDQNLDAVFGNWEERNRVCLGDGIGGFICSDVSADGYRSNSVALGLIDGDQHLDAVFANGGGGPTLLPRRTS